MQFDPVLIAPRRATMTAAGFWRDETITDHLARALSDCPDKTAVVAYRADADQPTRLTYRELDGVVDRLARGFVALGVVPGDVVSFQLPNWWEFVAIALACVRVGATANPIMPIFRERELTFMLNFGESKLFIVPATHRGFDYEAMAGELAGGLRHGTRILVVGGSGPDSLEVLMRRDDLPELGADSSVALHADDVLLLMYTSGTTGEPKGVTHTSNTLFANLHGFIDRLGLSGSDVVLGASPMAHLTGFGYLAMVPIVLHATTVLQDTWDGARALQIARDEGVTFSMASSPFVADLCAAAEAGGPVSPSFSIFCCAGAPIPPVLIERAHANLGLTVCSAWGMTENGAVTITEPPRALEKSGTSDGRPVPGMEVRVVDPDGHLLPPLGTGSLQVRGASMFGGYLKRPELNATDADGWFDTGDLAFLDDEGYVRIDGRSKDIVIRGGENIPVFEIENLLYEHPSVATVAIVGYPDERLGERACAFVSCRPDTTLTLDDMRAFLRERKVAVHYHPERLELLDEIPRTPSGKIQKFRLRELALG